MPHLTIITGASRGLGLAMAQQRLQEGHRLLTISRQPNPALNGEGVEQWAADLSQPLEVAQRLQAWLAALPAKGLLSLSLINNAALLAPMAPLSLLDLQALSAATRASHEAPLLLCSAFLRGSAAHSAVPRKILNISSGLGRSAMAGSAAYCAAKAGMDHMSRAVALEEAKSAQGAKVCSLAPGVIDTDMQVQIRSSPAEHFADLGRFVAMKTEGRLDSPATAAAKVLAYLDRPDFGTKPVADVRDA
jgi:benzil reductase ((S)-benzoin forming)